MIHITDFNGDIVDFISQSDGAVTEAEHMINVEDKLETFDFTILTSRTGNLQTRNRILITDKDGQYREFIIYNISSDLNGYTRVQTNASALEDIKTAKPVAPHKLDKYTVKQALEYALADTGWEVSDDSEWGGTRTTSWTGWHDRISILKQLETTYDMRVSFSVEVGNNNVSKRLVTLKKVEPLFKGEEIVYGDNMIDLKRTVDFSDIATALICLGPEDGETGKREIVEIKDDDAQSQFGLPYRYIWDIYEPESSDENMTRQRLTTLGRTALNKRKQESISYEIDGIGLSASAGDMIRVKNEDFTPELYVDAEVVEVTTDLISGESQYKFGVIKEYTRDDVYAKFYAMLDNLRERLNNVTNNADNIISERLEKQLDEFERYIHKSEKPPLNPKEGDLWLKLGTTTEKQQIQEQIDKLKQDLKNLENLTQQDRQKLLERIEEKQKELEDLENNKEIKEQQNKDEIERLNRLIYDFVQEIKEHRDRHVEELNNDIDRKNAEIEKLNNTIEDKLAVDIENKRKEYNAEIEELEDKRKELASERNNLQEEIERLQAQYDKFEKEYQANVEERNAGSVKELNAIKEQTNAYVELINKKRNEHVERLRGEITNNEQEIAELEEVIEELKRKAIEDKTNQYNLQIEKLTAERDELIAEQSQRDEEIERLENDIKYLENKINQEYNEALSEWQNRLDELEQQEDKSESDITNREQELQSEYETELNQLKEDLNSKTTERDTELERLETERAELVAEYEESIASVKQEIEDKYSRDTEEYLSEKERLENEIAEVERKIERLKNLDGNIDVEQVKSDIQRLESRKQEVLNELDNAGSGSDFTVEEDTIFYYGNFLEIKSNFENGQQYTIDFDINFNGANISAISTIFGQIINFNANRDNYRVTQGNNKITLTSSATTEYLYIFKGELAQSAKGSNATIKINSINSQNVGGNKEQLQSELNLIEQQLEELNRQLELAKQNDAELQLLIEQLENLQSQHANLTPPKRDNSRVEELQSELSDLNNQPITSDLLNSLNKAIDELQTQIVKLTSGEIGERISELQSQIEALKMRQSKGEKTFYKEVPYDEIEKTVVRTKYSTEGRYHFKPKFLPKPNVNYLVRYTSTGTTLVGIRQIIDDDNYISFGGSHNEDDELSINVENSGEVYLYVYIDARRIIHDIKILEETNIDTLIQELQSELDELKNSSHDEPTFEVEQSLIDELERVKQLIEEHINNKPEKPVNDEIESLRLQIDELQSLDNTDEVNELNDNIERVKQLLVTVEEDTLRDLTFEETEQTEQLNQSITGLKERIEELISWQLNTHEDTQNALDLDKREGYTNQFSDMNDLFKEQKTLENKLDDGMTDEERAKLRDIQDSIDQAERNLTEFNFDNKDKSLLSDIDSIKRKLENVSNEVRQSTRYEEHNRIEELQSQISEIENTITELNSWKLSTSDDYEKAIELNEREKYTQTTRQDIQNYLDTIRDLESVIGKANEVEIERAKRELQALQEELNSFDQNNKYTAKIDAINRQIAKLYVDLENASDDIVNLTPQMYVFKDGQWVKASVDNVEELGGMTKEQTLYDTLELRYARNELGYVSAFNRYSNLTNDKYYQYVKEELKENYSKSMSDLSSRFVEFKTAFEAIDKERPLMTLIAEAISKAIKFEEELKRYEETYLKVRESYDEYIRILQAQYTEEKWQEAMEEVANAIGGTWNGQEIIANIPNQQELEDLNTSIRQYLNGELTALDGKLGKQIETVVNQAKDQFTVDVNTIDRKVDGLNGTLSNIRQEVSETNSNLSVLEDRINLKADSNTVKQILDNELRVVRSNVQTNASELQVLSNRINSKVESSTYQADKDNIVSDLRTARSEINQLSDKVTSVITVDEYKNGTSNLLLDSGSQPSTTDYIIKEYDMTEKFENNKTYTFQLKGAVTNSNFSYKQIALARVYNGSLYYIKYNIYRNSDGIYEVTFTTDSSYTWNTDKLRVFNYPSGYGNRATIEWAKLEKGAIGTAYYPAPNDNEKILTQMQSEIEQTKLGLNTKVSYTEMNGTQQTLEKLLTEFSQTSSGFNFRIDSNGMIQDLTFDRYRFKLNSNLIEFNNGDVLIKDGVTSIKNLSFDKLSGGTAKFGGSNHNGSFEVYDIEDNPIMKLDYEQAVASELSLGTLNVEKINSPNVITTLDVDREYRVDRNLYSDYLEPTLIDEIDGTASTDEDNTDITVKEVWACATLTPCVNHLPKYINSSVTFNISGGTNDEEFINIGGFGGNTTNLIDFVFNDSRDYWYNFRLRSNNAPIRIGGNSGSTPKIFSTTINSSGIQVFDCIYTIIKNVRLNGDNKVQRGIWCSHASNIYVLDVVVEQFDIGIYLTEMGRVYATGVSGANNYYGIRATTGSIVSGSGTAPSSAPTGKQGGMVNTGGAYTWGNWNYSSNSTKPPVSAPSKPKTTTKRWSTSSARVFYRNQPNNWTVTFMRDFPIQGRWDNWGFRDGAWFFGAGMRNELRGKTIKRIRVSIGRSSHSSQGFTGSRTFSLRLHNRSTKPASNNNTNPTYSSQVFRGSLSMGERKWFDVTSAFANALSSGTWYGFGVKTDSTSQYEYMAMMQSITVEVTYE